LHLSIKHGHSSFTRSAQGNLDLEAEPNFHSDFWRISDQTLGKLVPFIADLFGGVRCVAGMSYDIYGETLDLRAGVEPEVLLVMEIYPEILPSNGSRHYLFTRSYNIYEDGNWQISIGQTADYDPANGNPPFPIYAAREIINTIVAPMVPAINAIVAPDSPIWVSRSGEIDFITLQNGTIDVVRLKANGFIRSGDQYAARASITIPTVLELRQAENQYPDWVLANYFQISDQISDRTRQLAQTITEGIENSYDRATAITSWQRKNIAYSRTTKSPPSDAESIDWFLFDYKVGFCNWYATAEVVLLRSLGIPSRMSVGYASGIHHATEAYYEVRGGDAHAWPEVYFPGYGWVEFEPTGNLSPLIRSTGIDKSEINPFVDSTFEAIIDRENTLDLLDRSLSDQFLEDDFGLENGTNSTEFLSALTILAIVALSGIGLWFRFDPVTRMIVFAGIAAGLQLIGINPPNVLPR